MTILLTPSVRKKLYQEVMNATGELTHKEYTGEDAKELIKKAKELILENNSALFAGFGNTDKDLQQELLEVFDEVLVIATREGIDDKEKEQKGEEKTEKIAKLEKVIKGLEIAIRLQKDAEKQEKLKKALKGVEIALRLQNK